MPVPKFFCFSARRTGSPSTSRRVVSAVIATIMAGTMTACATAEPNIPIPIPMTAARWTPTGDARFVQQQGYPGGVLELAKGSAVLEGLTFADGTIEFDTRLTGKGILGIRFRRQDAQNADVLYFRPQVGCPTSVDCMQYMPQSHGSFEWDLFPEYQTAAPIVSDGWNHIRMVISGRRMQVFVNGGSKPTLTVGHLEGDLLRGGLSLHGPASFANLVVTPDRQSTPPTSAVPDPTAADPNYVRNWLVAKPVTITSHIDPVMEGPTGDAVDYGQMPGAEGKWKRVVAERKGLMNLTHAIGSNKSGAVISLAWAKTSIRSSHAQTVHVDIGWAREIWVFANGRPVFTDRNVYGVPALAKKPDSAISLQNGGFDLPLVRGANEIVVAIDDNFSGNNHFGWGYIMRLRTKNGVTLDSGRDAEKAGRGRHVTSG